jgi:hypothetical protein
MAQTPLRTETVNTFADGMSPRVGYTKVRLSLTTNESRVEDVRVAGVAVCSASQCYESRSTSIVAVATSANGASALLVHLEVPHGEIQSVRFRSVPGSDVLSGNVALSQSIDLEPSFKGGEVLVVIQKRRGAAGYESVATASNLLRPEAFSVYYNPRIETSVKLPYGTVLTIPAGASTAPQIFSVALHDTGDEFPLIDIYPVIQLAKAATVQLSTIPRVPKPLMSGQPPPTPAPSPAAPGGVISAEPQRRPLGPRTIKREILSTGVVRAG